jgi:hypothetical protein
MNVSVMAVSYAVQRGEKIAGEFDFSELLSLDSHAF